MPAPSPTTSKTRAASARRSAAGRSVRCSLSARSTPCDTRNTGLSELNGSWNTIGTWPLYRSPARRDRSADSGLPAPGSSK